MRYEDDLGRDMIAVPIGPTRQRFVGVASIGILFTFEEFVADALADGRLVRVLKDWQEEFAGPRLYYNSRRQMPAALGAFVDFVRSKSRGA